MIVAESLAAQLGAAYREVNETRRWMESCGGTRAGYRARYGIVSHGQYVGDGGDAIYEADLAALRRAEAHADDVAKRFNEARS